MASRPILSPVQIQAVAERRKVLLGDHAETFDYWKSHRGGRASFVYLLTEWERDIAGDHVQTEFCKIGVAGDPAARISGLKTGNPRHMQLSGLILGGANVERAMHRRWRYARVERTEWFADVSSYLFVLFREIAYEQRQLPPTSSLQALELVVDRANMIDRATGAPLPEFEGCTGEYVCPCAICEQTREYRVRRGVRPRAA